MNDTHQHVAAHVGGSWWTAAAGWVLSIWTALADGMPPLAAAVAIATLVLTVIKIAQEIRAWRRSDDERTPVRKLLERAKRGSGFGAFQSTQSDPSLKAGK